MMNIFEVLKEEHSSLKETLSEVLELGEKGDAFSDFKDEFDCHTRGEEKYLYPESSSAGFKELALLLKEEHDAARILLKQMDGMSGKEETWVPKAKVFQELITAHIQREEDSLLPRVEQKMDERKVGEMTKKYEELKGATV